jgi:hypothetical protein
MCQHHAMTKMLDEAIKRVRELPDNDQDAAAEILSIAAKRGPPVELDDETRQAIQEGHDQARRGEFASDEEVNAFFNRHGAQRHRR